MINEEGLRKCKKGEALTESIRERRGGMFMHMIRHDCGIIQKGRSQESDAADGLDERTQMKYKGKSKSWVVSRRLVEMVSCNSTDNNFALKLEEEKETYKS